MTVHPVEPAVVGPAPVDPRARPCAVAMRDGVELAADLYLPDGLGRDLATVLIRLPYDKSGRYTFMASIAGYLNAHGFAVVAQDVRGKFRSGGERFPFVNEREDGCDTLDWIVAQPWSDGTVGMLGDSYYGFTQWAAAASGHPALKAIVPRVTGSRFMEMFARELVPKIPLYEWAAHTFAHAGQVPHPVLSQRPLDGYAAITPEAAHMPAVVEQLSAMCDDGSLLATAFPAGAPAERLTLPALHMGGWWDNLQRSQLDDWRAVLGSPAAAHQFLRMDATDHEDFELREGLDGHENHEIDDDALLRYLPRMLDEPISFLRHYLSGRPGRWSAPRVRYRLARDGGMQVADRWPPADVSTVELHLGAGARSVRSADGGTLTTTPDAERSVAEWTHDPADPVPFLVADEWGQLAGLPDESELHERADVATFTTAAQARPCDVVGPVELTVTVTADAPSTHVVARLLDVDPSGRARMVLEGAALARTADGPATVHLRMGDTAYRLRPGHRLRLALSSSCFPLYVVHPGTDEDPWHATTSRTVGHAIGTGGGELAILRLPLRGALG